MKTLFIACFIFPSGRGLLLDNQFQNTYTLSIGQCKKINATYFSSGNVISRSVKTSGIVTAANASSRPSSGRSTTPGRKAILILTKASVQSAKRYLVFLEYILTTPSRRCPDVLRASLTLGEIMLSTDDGRSVSETSALLSLRSQWAASHTLAKGAFLAKINWW